MQNYETVLNDMQPKSGKLFVPKNKCGLYDIIPAEDFSAENTVKDAIDELQTQTQDKIDIINNRIRNINDDIDDLESIIPSNRFSAQSTVKDYIDIEVSEVADLLPASAFDSVNTVQESINGIADLLPSSAFDSVNTVRDALNGRVRAFETVADMAAATDLAADMICHTNGFHTSGDGGAAFYEIKSTGTVNAMDIIACQDSLFAHLVITEPFVTPEQFGAYGDGTHDDTSVLQYVIDMHNVIKLGKKSYLISSKLILKDNTSIFGHSSRATIILANNCDAMGIANTTDNYLLGCNLAHFTIKQINATKTHKGLCTQAFCSIFEDIVIINFQYGFYLFGNITSTNYQPMVALGENHCLKNCNAYNCGMGFWLYTSDSFYSNLVAGRCDTGIEIHSGSLNGSHVWGWSTVGYAVTGTNCVRMNNIELEAFIGSGNGIPFYIKGSASINNITIWNIGIKTALFYVNNDNITLSVNGIFVGTYGNLNPSLENDTQLANIISVPATRNNISVICKGTIAPSYLTGSVAVNNSSSSSVIMEIVGNAAQSNIGGLIIATRAKITATSY